MSYRKLAVVLFALALAYSYSSIFVVDEFESPNIYRLFHVFIKLISITAKTTHFLGINPEYNTLRVAFSALAQKQLSSNMTERVKVQDRLINGVLVRVYSPNISSIDSPMPIFVFIHGGGFVLGTIEFYNAFLYDLVRNFNMTAISIEYSKSPENPYPSSLNECWSVLTYVLEHPGEFNADLTRLIFSGDSAGGNMALVLTNRLIRRNMTKPRLLVPIYPWLQMVTLRTPSYFKYHTPILASLSFENLVLWYLGYTEISPELKEMFERNDHLFLVDKHKLDQLRVYFNLSTIPDVYKKNKSYYDNFDTSDSLKTSLDSLPSDHLLLRDRETRDKIKLVFDDELSPGLVDDELLKQYPSVYHIICEWDAIKDEQIVFAQRLARLGVNVKIKFYERCFHGMVTNVDKGIGGFDYAIQVADELNTYLKRQLYV